MKIQNWPSLISLWFVIQPGNKECSNHQGVSLLLEASYNTFVKVSPSSQSPQIGQRGKNGQVRGTQTKALLLFMPFSKEQALEVLHYYHKKEFLAMPLLLLAFSSSISFSHCLWVYLRFAGSGPVHCLTLCGTLE